MSPEEKFWLIKFPLACLLGSFLVVLTLIRLNPKLADLLFP